MIDYNSISLKIQLLLKFEGSIMKMLFVSINLIYYGLHYSANRRILQEKEKLRFCFFETTLTKC
jgi:hypothetical protein